MSFNGYVVNYQATGLVLDLKNGAVTPPAGTTEVDVIIQTDSKDPPTLNQQWRLIPVSAGNNLYTIQNVQTSTYAVVNGDCVSGANVIGSSVSMPWELVPVGSGVSGNRAYIIKAPYSPFAWNPTSTQALTNVALAAYDGTVAQQWSFTAID